MTKTLNRREFIKTGLAAGAVSLAAPSLVLSQLRERKVRLGFIGVGLRGRDHIDLVLRRDDCEVMAICDIDPQAIEASEEMIVKAGKKKAAVYADSEEAFLRLVARNDIDGVIISTPWTWHTRMAVATMKSGKYAGVEVPAAVTLEECWDLVNTSEVTGMPCIILENVCYRRDVMAILNMVRQNLFGELVHMECGYQHDLRNIKFQPGVEFGEKGRSESRWRTLHSIERNGDLYPTHGVGPVATMLDINRGNRFVYLTSTASKTRGLHDYVLENGGVNHPNAKIEFKLGDVVTTVIKTSEGETIIVSHDTNLPRPYSLGFRVQGTKGIWMDVNKSLYLEGMSAKSHQWEPAEPYLQQYDHPLWKKYQDRAIGAGHGGMDYFVVNAFVESIKRKAPAPLDVYDAATWSAVSALSEQSIAGGGTRAYFPDFTRGKWMGRGRVFALGDEY